MSLADEDKKWFSGVLQALEHGLGNRLQDVEESLRNEMQNLDEKLRNELQGLEKWFDDRLRNELQNLEERFDEKLRAVETVLLTEFHKWASPRGSTPKNACGGAARN